MNPYSKIVADQSCPEPPVTWWNRARVARAFTRLAGLSLISLTHWLRLTAALPFTPREDRPLARARALQTASALTLQALGVHCDLRGAVPTGGLLASNHLSYLDVLVLAALCPMTFVAKKEVSRWPLIGALVRRFGCLFIQRSRVSDLPTVIALLENRVGHGLVVCIFPEGTTTDGSFLAPFKSALFEPATAHGWPVTAARIDYATHSGSVEHDICYWGDMSFPSHLIKLLSLERITACVRLVPVPESNSRKALARVTRKTIAGLDGRGGRKSHCHASA